MKRHFTEILKHWLQDPEQVPLLLIGARQVGKTWVVRDFCESSGRDYIVLNFESTPALASVFRESLEPREILRSLSALLGRKITAETILFFDEIQKCEEAITSLKYFCEAREKYTVIAAGSLLGVKLKRFETSFPVGKVRILHLYPLSFAEFLEAAGEGPLLDYIQTAFRERKALPEILHHKALQYYRDYLFVGGMPGCVAEYIKSRECSESIREIQRNILTAYSADMAKYADSAMEGAKIQAIYDSLPRQMARENPKFKYKEVRQHGNRRDFSLPLDWLLASGMVHRIPDVEQPRRPLRLYAQESSFKLYLSDVGLLTCAMGLHPADLGGSVDNLYKGAIAENYVIQELIVRGWELYYYRPDPGMEIDLLVDTDKGVIPLEIKAGLHKRSTSLKRFAAAFAPPLQIRISSHGYGMTDTLLSLPLYMAGCLERSSI